MSIVNIDSILEKNGQFEKAGSIVVVGVKPKEVAFYFRTETLSPPI